MSHTQANAPRRILFHGNAPSLSNHAMKPGTFRDIPLSTQFLVDLEFLTLHTSTGATCIYTSRPPYMDTIARYFPWVHFYVFACEDIDDYDPDRPCMQGEGPASLQTNGNITSSCFAFTKETALDMGKRNKQEFLVMICHEHEIMMQLVLHALLNPNFSLLDLPRVPEDYAQGQIFLPFCLPRDRCMAFLVATSPARSTSYDPAEFEREIAYLQVVQRETQTHDNACTDFIIDEYAARYQHAMSTPGILLVMNLKLELQRLEDTADNARKLTKIRGTDADPSGHTDG